jgi:hypothetical protein
MGNQYASNITPSNRGVQQDQIKTQTGMHISHAAISLITSSTNIQKTMTKSFSLFFNHHLADSIQSSIQACQYVQYINKVTN